MARYTGKKNRIARRFGVNIFGRKRNPLIHKPNPPGVHGAKRRKKSDYGLQLEEKQRLKACYGMLSEKNLHRYYREAVRRPGNTMTHLVELLESRLDIVVYRLGFASTIFQAHQLVAHGHVEVDGKKVDIRSYLVKPGQVISIREKSKGIKAVQDALAFRGDEIASYLERDKDKMTGQMLAYPTSIDEVPLPVSINIPMVCEFLAHTM